MSLWTDRINPCNLVHEFSVSLQNKRLPLMTCMDLAELHCIPLHSPFCNCICAPYLSNPHFFSTLL